MSIVAVGQAVNMLAIATEPKQTKAVEAMASAAQAWAKENNDYEMFVAAAHLYIMARRKTTELILPYIQHGGNGSNQYKSKGNEFVTLADFGFTKMQWSRRVRELELSSDEIDGYFDECIAKKWEPSLFGLTRYMSPQEPVIHAEWCNVNLKCNCGAKE